MVSWKQSLDEIIEELDRRDKAREQLLKTTREIVRKCRDAVYKIHSRDFLNAEKTLLEAKKLVSEVNGYKNDFPFLYYSGSINNALTEYVEAVTLFYIVVHRRLVLFHELSVTIPSYLAGLGDAIGELRRYIISLIKQDDLSLAWELFELMEKLYFELSKLSYPEALIPGLRHKVDVARVLIENTRKDLLFYERSSQLIEIMEKAIKCGEKG